MRRKACFNPTFSNPVSSLGASSAPLKLIIPHAGFHSFQNIPSRPFIPLWGLSVTVIDGENIYTPLSVANNQLAVAINTLLEMALESARASFNWINETPGSTFLTTETQYKSNLYSELYGKPLDFARYVDLYTKVYNFWQSADPAWTASQYYANRTALINKLIAEGDKSLYIPPNDYLFANTSQFIVNYNLWVAAAPTLDSIECLELYV